MIRINKLHTCSPEIRIEIKIKLLRQIAQIIHQREWRRTGPRTFSIWLWYHMLIMNLGIEFKERMYARHLINIAARILY